MKQKKRTFLYIVAAAMLVVVLIGGLAIYDRQARNRDGITLPTADAQTAQGENAAANDAFVQVTPQNAAQVVKTLTRPRRYHLTLLQEYYAENVQSSRTVTDLWVSGGVTKISAHKGSETRNILTDGATAYVWYRNSSTVETVHLTEDMTVDALAGVPTYETILNLSPETIRRAEYVQLDTLDGAPCLLAEVATSETLTTTYWVDLSTGLLCQARGTIGSDPVFSLKQTALEQPDADDAAFDGAFRLPNGQTPFAIAAE